MVLILLLLTVVGCKKQHDKASTFSPIDPAVFNAAQAFQETDDFVKIYPRDAGTPGAKKAADYLQQRLQSFGLEAFIDTFEDESPLGNTTFHNVFGRIPGTEPGTIILASHFDSKAGMKPGFTGANDSGSSTGILLELARVLAAQPPLPAEILFVFFDGEECMKTYGPHDGFHGSKHLASQLVEEGNVSDIIAMILLDMVGDRDYSITLPPNSSPELATLLLNAAHAEGIRSEISLINYAMGDDHVAFLDIGVPAIDIIDFEFGSAPGKNDYWHTPEDAMDKVSAESLGKSGRLTIRMLNDLLSKN